MVNNFDVYYYVYYYDDIVIHFDVFAVASWQRCVTA